MSTSFQKSQKNNRKELGAHAREIPKMIEAMMVAEPRSTTLQMVRLQVRLITISKATNPNYRRKRHCGNRGEPGSHLIDSETTSSTERNTSSALANLKQRKRRWLDRTLLTGN